MAASRSSCLVFLLLLATACDFSGATSVSDELWREYRRNFTKNYPDSDGVTEATARYYFAYNKNLIDTHNLQADRGVHTYRLAPNKFSDMRFITFKALFRQVSNPTTQGSTASLPPFPPSVPSYDPRTFGLQASISEQGRHCNSGWAYATAKAVEILNANQQGILTPAELSAQNLIDCAGRSQGCTNQHPQAAFDYLTVHGQELYTAQYYQNVPTSKEQNVCIRPSGSNLPSASLNNYAYLPVNNDENVRRLLPTNPVVAEYDPTSFQFMHYASGVFQKPSSYRGSHFLTVVGFGTDAATGKDYWLALNSFGETWGEGGYIKILRSTADAISKNAIVPMN